MIKVVPISTVLLDIPPFRIQGNKYATPVFAQTKDNKFKIGWSEIQSLHEPLFYCKELKYDLSFPFKLSRTYTLYPSDKGYTRQSLIDEIRRSYRHLFRHSDQVALQWESSTYKKNTTQYQVSYPFSGLYVDKVYYNKENNSLEIIVDGNPIPQNSLDMPF